MVVLAVKPACAATASAQPLALLDADNSVPFIARFTAKATGALRRLPTAQSSRAWNPRPREPP